MKRSIILLIISLFQATTICAQDIYNSDTNNFILSNEVSNLTRISGSGITLKKKLHSSNSGKLHLYSKAGLIAGTTSPIFKDTKSFNGAHTSFALTTNSNNHHFEINVGTYIISETNEENKIEGIFRIGQTQITLFPLVDFVYQYQIPSSRMAINVKISAIGLGFGIGYAI